MKETLLFFAQYPGAFSAVLATLFYLVLNLWKFDKPTTPLGKAVMRTVAKCLFVSWQVWGLKNPRIPFMPDPDDLKALDEPDEKEPEK